RAHVTSCRIGINHGSHHLQLGSSARAYRPIWVGLRTKILDEEFSNERARSRRPRHQHQHLIRERRCLSLRGTWKHKCLTTNSRHVFPLQESSRMIDSSLLLVKGFSIGGAIRARSKQYAWMNF